MGVAIVLDLTLSNPPTLATGEGVRFNTAALGDVFGVVEPGIMLMRDSTNVPGAAPSPLAVVWTLSPRSSSSWSETASTCTTVA